MQVVPLGVGFYIYPVSAPGSDPFLPSVAHRLVYRYVSELWSSLDRKGQSAQETLGQSG